MCDYAASCGLITKQVLLLCRGGRNVTLRPVAAMAKPTAIAETKVSTRDSPHPLRRRDKSSLNPRISLRCIRATSNLFVVCGPVDPVARME